MNAAALIAEAATANIAHRINNTDHVLSESRLRYIAAMRRTSAWVKDANTVVVDVQSDRYRYVAGDILDAACNAADMTGDGVHIFTTDRGALVRLACSCDIC